MLSGSSVGTTASSELRVQINDFIARNDNNFLALTVLPVHTVIRA